MSQSQAKARYTLSQSQAESSQVKLNKTNLSQAKSNQSQSSQAKLIQSKSTSS